MVNLGQRMIVGLFLLTPSYQFSSVQFSTVAQSCPTLCDPMNRTRQASLSITNSRNSLRLTSIESVMPSSHLILCRPLLLLPSIPLGVRNPSVLCSVAQSCLTLCDPMDCSLPGSCVHGISQARIPEWVAIPFSRGSSPPRDRTHISYISCIARHVRYHQHHLGSANRN